MVVARIQPGIDICPGRPFLKWAGGKGQLLEQFDALFPSPENVNRYFEPFLGSGAVFFHLMNQQRIAGIPVFLSDINGTLMDLWMHLRDEPSAVIQQLRKLQLAYDPQVPEIYYTNRERFNALGAVSSIEKSALFIALNRTCFNGLYRENSKGHFNVPVGRYANPRILDEENLWAVHQTLQGIDLQNRPYVDVLHTAQKGDFVYFDPPYYPRNKTSQFAQYSRDGFRAQDHETLTALFIELTRRGVHCMLSNSDAPFVIDLFKEAQSVCPTVQIHKVQARRTINSKATNRQAIFEVVVTNY